MAVTNGRTSAGLIQHLYRHPYRFEFFQAVRVLERAASDSREGTTRHSVGHDVPPGKEVVRFRVPPSLSFPPASVLGLHQPAPGAGRDQPEMTVAFLGLTGPSGVLPQHYTSLLIERCHVKNKDYTLRDYFDLFHHRLISLFHRAWEKYRFPFVYERTQRERPGEEDLFTFALFSLVGLGTGRLRGRMEVDDEAVLYYGGHFAHFPRSSIGLESLLNDYFQNPIEIEQFRGQWLYLSEDEQTQLPTPAQPGGLNCRLGIETVVGNRVWDIQSMFRIRIGPVHYAEFLDFMPTGRRLLPLCQMVRLYAGAQYDFDVQVVLRKEEVPACQFTSDPATGPRLGWNTWVRSQPMENDAEDAVFRLEQV